jgi:hypothetical protein
MENREVEKRQETTSIQSIMSIQSMISTGQTAAHSDKRMRRSNS